MVRKSYGSGSQSPAEFDAEWIGKNETRPAPNLVGQYIITAQVEAGDLAGARRTSFGDPGELAKTCPLSAIERIQTQS